MKSCNVPACALCILYVYFSVTVDVTKDRLVRLEMDAGSYAEGLVLVAKYYEHNDYCRYKQYEIIFIHLEKIKLN